VVDDFPLVLRILRLRRLTLRVAVLDHLHHIVVL